MTSCEGERILVPSEEDILLTPELAPLFVLDAAIEAARAILSIGLDPTSSMLGGADHPPTRGLLDAMRALRTHIRRYRRCCRDGDGDGGY